MSFGIVKNPWESGMLLLPLTTGVVVSGTFFARRTWCRYLCFLGGLSGNYARAGMVALRATPEVCATCKSKAACFNGNEKDPAVQCLSLPVRSRHLSRFSADSTDLMLQCDLHLVQLAIIE